MWFQAVVGGRGRDGAGVQGWLGHGGPWKVWILSWREFRKSISLQCGDRNWRLVRQEAKRGIRRLLPKLT